MEKKCPTCGRQMRANIAMDRWYCPYVGCRQPSTALTDAELVTCHLLKGW